MDVVQAPARPAAGAEPPGRPPDSSHRPGRRARRALSSALIVAGAVVLIDVAVTLIWQEPISALYAHFHQRALAAQPAGSQPLTPPPRRGLERLRTERRRIALLAGVLARRGPPRPPARRPPPPPPGGGFLG